MWFLVLLFGLAGCLGRNIPYEGGPGGDDSTVVTSACGEEVDTSAGFVVVGPTRDVPTGGAAAAGLCVTVVDPTPALTGGTPTPMAASVVCEDGSFRVGPVAEAPAIGMFVVIDDCEGGGDVVLRTATGVPPDALAGLGAGDSLTVEALLVTSAWAATEQADLERVGWSGDLAAGGYMAGIVEDASLSPVSGAAVGCDGCATVYYEDANRADGIYGAEAVANTATESAAGAYFLIPSAPIFSYTCTDGGAHTWDPTLLGSLPGFAVYIRFTAA